MPGWDVQTLQLICPLADEAWGGPVDEKQIYACDRCDVTILITPGVKAMRDTLLTTLDPGASHKEVFVCKACYKDGGDKPPPEAEVEQRALAGGVTSYRSESCPCDSGKTFLQCHGSLPLPPPPALAPDPTLVRLDLGCGQHPREGFEGVDLLAPNAKHKVDLFKFPWPFEDESVDELHASHFVEHIPARDVDERDIKPYCNNLHLSWLERIGIAGDETLKRFEGQDMLFAFFDECYRILKPGGVMKVIVPALQSVRAFQDPTHRRFIPAETFMYLNADWRKSTGLDHYRVRCDFAGNINHTCDTAMNLLHPEAAMRRFKENWNTIVDFHVDLTKK